MEYKITLKSHNGKLKKTKVLSCDNGVDIDDFLIGEKGIIWEFFSKSVFFVEDIEELNEWGE